MRAKTVAKDPDCGEDVKPVIHWEKMESYKIGMGYGAAGKSDKENPWIRSVKPNQWLAWFRGWLAGRYKTP